MIQSAVYKNIEVQLHDQTTGVLGDILVDTKINDARPSLLELTYNAVADQYSESKTISVYCQNLRAATLNDRTRTRVMHQDLPPDFKLNMGMWDGAWFVDEFGVAPGDAFVGPPIVPNQNAALNDYRAPLYTEHDAATGLIGRVRFQFEKPVLTVTPYDWKKDRGNTGITTIRFDIPTTEGTISVRGTERADETVGSGPTRVYVRPLYRLGTGTSLENLSWSRFHEIGCLASDIELERVREYSEQIKGFNKERIAKTITQNLMNFNCKSQGDTEYLTSIIDNANVSYENELIKVQSRSGGLEVFEVVLETLTPAGMFIWWRLPEAYIIANGTVTEGGTEKTIPFQVQSNQPAIKYQSKNLYQTIELAIGLVI